MKSEGNTMAVSNSILTDQEVEHIVHDIIEPREGWFHRWFPFLKWSPSSPDQLRQAEEELLDCKLFLSLTAICKQPKKKKYFAAFHSDKKSLN